MPQGPGRLVNRQATKPYRADASTPRWIASADWAEAKAEIDAELAAQERYPRSRARVRADGSARTSFSWARRREGGFAIYDPWPWNANICQGGNIVWEDWDSVTHTNFIYVRHA